MKRFIAFSLGVESTTMCIKYGKGATAIFTDTGSEHKELYERLEKVQLALQIIHNGDFEIKVIRAVRKAGGVECRSLGEEIEAKKFMPSKQHRFCTVNWKIIPMDNYLKSQGECELLIGLNADEEPGKDRTGNLMRCKNVHYRYPLYEDGLDRDDCKAILEQYDLAPNFPVYMARGGCKWCPFKSVNEYIAMYLFDRDTFEEGRAMEKRIQDKRKNYFAISMSTLSFDQIADKAEMEAKLWGEDVLKSHFATVAASSSCGSLCHK